MNILVVWDGDYPWDIRVDKIVTTLNENEHNVSIACRNLARKPLLDKFKGTTLYRLPFLSGLFQKLNALVSFPAFFSPFWLWHIKNSALRSNAELIIVRDLPMAIAAIRVAKKINVPCVLDMAECYPEMLKCIREFEGFKLKNVLLRNSKMAAIVEAYTFKHIDEVWAMIEESEELMIKKGVPSDKIRIVSNTPKLERFETSNFIQEDNKFRLIYVGLMNPSRGVKIAIDAAVKYRNEDSNFEFVIIGSGKDLDARKKQVDSLKANHYIKFMGWVNNENIPSLIGNASVGIVPHFKCEHWDNTIPNKLFDYMAAQRAVIVSDVVPMARIVKKQNCGLVYSDTDSDSLVSVLRELSNISRRTLLAENGRKSIESEFNWKREEVVILEAIDAFNTVSALSK